MSHFVDVFFRVNEAEVQASPEIRYTFHPAKGIGSPNDHLPRKSERPMTCQAVVKNLLFNCFIKADLFIYGKCYSLSDL